MSSQNNLEEEDYLNQYHLILSKLSECDSIIDEVKDKDIILLVGNAKAGKSSVCNAIIGNALMGNKTKFGKTYNIVAANANKGPKIGKNKTAETSLPSVWPSTKTFELIVDAPGFDDNRGEAQDIANCVYIKKIMTNVRSMKLILVCNIYDVVDDNINNFISLMDKVHTILPSLEDLLPGIGIIFTKDRDDYSVDDLTKVMRNMFNEPELRIKKTLLKHFGDGAHNIAIFPAPTADGPLHNDTVARIINIIKNVQIIPRDLLSDTRVGISGKSTNFLLYAKDRILYDEEYHELLILEQYREKFKFPEFQDKSSAEQFKAKLEVMQERLDGFISYLQSHSDMSSCLKVLEELGEYMPTDLKLKIKNCKIVAVYHLLEFISDILNHPLNDIVKKQFKQMIYGIQSIINVSLIEVMKALNEITKEEYERKQRYEKVMNQELEVLKEKHRYHMSELNASRQEITNQQVSQGVFLAATGCVAAGGAIIGCVATAVVVSGILSLSWLGGKMGEKRNLEDTHSD